LTTEASFEELKRLHADLDFKLEEEVQRPKPDQTIITRIKREKLKLKDAIAFLEQS
jgi:hypothetical protein|tara:strand:+ start:726 stop:893 length:168 start_codon:yes stop_codon:yes gene_type:complete